VSIFPPAYLAGDTTVYLFTDASLHSVPHPYRFVYFWVMTQKNVDGSARQNLLFYSAQSILPHKTHARKAKHILGMLTSPRSDSHCPKLCRLSCTPITNTPRKYPFSVVLGTCITLCAEIRNSFNGLHMHTPIHVFHFKNAQNRCKVSGRKPVL